MITGRLAQLSAHHRITVACCWLVLAVAGLVLAAGGATPHGLFSHVTTGVPVVPGSDSAAADAVVADGATAGPAVTLIVDGLDLASSDAAAAENAIKPAATALGRVHGIDTVIDPLALPGGTDNPAASALVAKDRRGFLVVAELRQDLEPDLQATALDAAGRELRAAAHRLNRLGLTTAVGGAELAERHAVREARDLLAWGGAAGLVLALLVLAFALGAGLPALVPAGAGVGAAAVELGILALAARRSTLQLATVAVGAAGAALLAAGLATAVTVRYRRTLLPGLAAPVPAAGARRRRSALTPNAARETGARLGYPVTGVAVGAAVAATALLWYRMSFTNTAALAGIGAAALAWLAALTLTPALLALFGPRLADPSWFGRVPGLGRAFQRRPAAPPSATPAQPVRQGDPLAWPSGPASAASTAAPRPNGTARVRRWPVIVGLVALLATAPAGAIALIGDTYLAVTHPAQARYTRLLAAHFPAASAPQITVVSRGSEAATATWVSQELTGLEHVRDAATAQRNGYVAVSVSPDQGTGAPTSEDTQALVQEIRAHAPSGFTVHVTGQAAHLLDCTDRIAGRTGLAGGWTILGAAALAAVYGTRESRRRRR
ncbi:MAG: MMPL family transporter [Bifidobacteriaceae bacterium]|nr:MMPL family transporter [Bifidobacteriaceae bacterium]